MAPKAEFPRTVGRLHNSEEPTSDPSCCMIEDAALVGAADMID